MRAPYGSIAPLALMTGTFTRAHFSDLSMGSVFRMSPQWVGIRPSLGQYTVARRDLWWPNVGLHRTLLEGGKGIICPLILVFLRAWQPSNPIRRI